MKITLNFAIAAILAIAYADDDVDKPFHSKPWICTHLVRRFYNDAIMNAVMTEGVDCFDELSTLPDKIKDMTPNGIYTTYLAVGPYIGNSKTFRAVAVVEEELENMDLGRKMENQFAVDCFKCNVDYYDNAEVAICKELTMEECPERLSGELYWNPPGKITFSSDAEFCLYRRDNDEHQYTCLFFDADLDVVS
ncbi:uncharacterized protein [Ptychodera flava]|uniref:uncharacterized protein n=1 Tax=Ptychodera flava TaxID=63121 RepID=UPI003969E6C0